MRSFKALYLLIFVALSSLFNLTRGADHIVGGQDSGWDIGVDLQSWAQNEKFYVGDTLTFSYQVYHDVLEASQQNYETCTTTNALSTYTGGSTTVRLTGSGSRYFICGITRHCTAGMKIQVDVLPAISSPPPPVYSPPPPTASPPPPPTPVYSPPPPTTSPPPPPTPVYSPPPPTASPPPPPTVVNSPPPPSASPPPPTAVRSPPPPTASPPPPPIPDYSSSPPPPTPNYSSSPPPPTPDYSSPPPPTPDYTSQPPPSNVPQLPTYFYSSPPPPPVSTISLPPESIIAPAPSPKHHKHKKHHHRHAKAPKHADKPKKPHAYAPTVSKVSVNYVSRQESELNASSSTAKIYPTNFRIWLVLAILVVFAL